MGQSSEYACVRNRTHIGLMVWVVRIRILCKSKFWCKEEHFWSWETQEEGMDIYKGKGPKLIATLREVKGRGPEWP